MQSPGQDGLQACLITLASEAAPVHPGLSFFRIDSHPLLPLLTVSLNYALRHMLCGDGHLSFTLVVFSASAGLS